MRGRGAFEKMEKNAVVTTLVEQTNILYSQRYIYSKKVIGLRFVMANINYNTINLLN